MNNTKELKYILGYISKSLGFIDHNEYLFNEAQQYSIESILYSAMTVYSNGTASKARIAEFHKKFVKEIEQRKEERIGRTQELNTAKLQALSELGYTSLNNENAKEVLEKISEIISRRV